MDSAQRPQQQAKHAPGQDLGLAGPRRCRKRGMRARIGGAWRLRAGKWLEPSGSPSGAALPKRREGQPHDELEMAENDKAEATISAAKLVKAGVAVGIGSAAIVAALLYASKVKKKPRTKAAHSRPYHSSSRISWS